MTISTPAQPTPRSGEGPATSPRRTPVPVVFALTLTLSFGATLMGGATIASAAPPRQAGSAGAPSVLGLSKAARAPVRAAAAGTCVAAGAKVRAMRSCRYGTPVVVGDVLFLPRSCRLPLKSGPIERHTVEIRDAVTGRKHGQASLPPKPSTSGAPPRPGALIGGPYPLFVWQGGIAAIDAASKRARVVYEATGQLAAVARYGEVLALVDALPADKTFKRGSLEWTVLDFGAGELLGQLRAAPAPLTDIGIAKGSQGGRSLVAWLGLKGPKGPLEVSATIRGADGKPAAKGGHLSPRASAPKGRGLPFASGATAGPGQTCAVLTGRDAVITAAPWVDLGGTQVVSPASAKRTRPIPGCVAATPPTAKGVTWAWLAKPGSTPTLAAYRCAPPKK